MKGAEGIVFLVGAGPGDPGLLTIRGRDVLRQAQVVVYDHLVADNLLNLAPAQATRIFAGKSAGRCAITQEEINALLIENAKAGRRVVRLKGGDPFVFGRGAEEAEALTAAGVPFQVVPGVTAGVGATAYAGIPLTHRAAASAVAFVTGHDDPLAVPSRIDWSAIARFPGTVVIYMCVTRLASLCAVLIREGMAATTPAALVHAGTMAQQKTVVGTLGDLPSRAVDEGVRPPAVLVIGEVVHRRAGVSWFEHLPLFGQRIVVTRPTVEAEHSAAELQILGAETLWAPTVEIQPLRDFAVLDHTIERLHEFQWVVFTSSNGVRHFLDRLEARGQDLRVLGPLKLAAIGAVTARTLAEYHLTADLVPEAFRSESLAAALADRVRGCRVLLARADRGRAVLDDELGRIATVERVAVYRNLDVGALPPAVECRIEEGTVDWITLTSSAITERLHALLPGSARERIGREIRLASISPVTTETAARLGWRIAVEASEHTWNGLIAAIAGAVTSSRRT